MQTFSVYVRCILLLYAVVTLETTYGMLTLNYGRAIAQAVSRWLPTVAAWVRTRVWSSGICGGQSGTGAVFLQVLQFPLPICILPNSPSS
jgi:hypothetical protein